MILLEEFLNKIYSEEGKDPPMVWIYGGRESYNPNDKMCCLYAVCANMMGQASEKAENGRVSVRDSRETIAFV